jgi:cell division protein ZapA
MAQVTLTIGGHRYELACRDGEEPRLRALAELVDRKAQSVGQGSTNEARQLLMAALLLADELSDLREGIAVSADAAVAGTIDRLAQRIEILAARLEKTGKTS